MDASRFDTAVQMLAGSAPRRSLLGLTLGGVAARFGLVAAERKNHAQQHEKPCGPCQRRRNGKCKPKPNGTPCGNGGTCRGGKCKEPPPDPPCAETCDGCCEGSTCEPGDADGACGRAGESCVDCRPGSRCCGGACCDGCCSSGQCYPGTYAELCGSGGITCARCPIEEICTVDRVCAPPACGNGGPCRVFVTSLPVTGNLGGLEAADAICQVVADEAELSGVYRAWLSDDDESPSTRFMHSPGPYLLVNDTVVAHDWAELTSGTLRAPIDRDETGHDFLPPFKAWTNTKVDGTLDDSLADCDGWRTTAAFGGVGDFSARNGELTDSDQFEPCGLDLQLYCYQQS